MRPVSEVFLRTVRSSHRAIFRARVVDAFTTGTDPTGTDVPIIDGDVQFDSTADVRATLDLTVPGDLWTSDPSGLVVPYGNEVFVERGVEYGNGERDWVGLGYYRIYDTEQDNVPRGSVRLSGRDRMAGLIDSKLLAPVSFGSGHTIRQVFEALVLEVYPNASIVYDFNPDGVALGRAQVADHDKDRYPFLLDLCRSLGKVMFWDHDGSLRVKSTPDPSDPVFEVNAGAGGVLVDMSRKLSRDGVFNAVVATGEAPDGKPPVRAVARDMNPKSPTFWGGKFGQVPRFYSSTFITQGGQARTAAGAMLRGVLGLPYNVDLTTVPCPALEPLDPVRVIYSDRDNPEVHVLEKITVPLTPGAAMTATTREQGGATVNVGDA